MHVRYSSKEISTVAVFNENMMSSVSRAVISRSPTGVLSAHLLGYRLFAIHVLADLRGCYVSVIFLPMGMLRARYPGAPSTHQVKEKGAAKVGDAKEVSLTERGFTDEHHDIADGYACMKSQTAGSQGISCE